MANDDLQPFNIDVPLFAGQNSAADERVVEVGQQALVENGRFYTNGQIAKRYGVTSLPTQDQYGNTFTQGRQIIAAGNQLFFHDGNGFYIWNPLNTTWHALGGVNSLTVQSTVLAQSRTDVGEISSAATPDTVVITWSEGSTIKYSVYNPTNGTFIVAGATISTTGAKPNVVTMQSDFYICWVDTGAMTLKLGVIRSANLTAFTVVVDQAENGAGLAHTNRITDNAYYDMCASSTRVAIASSLRGGTNTIVNVVIYDGVVEYAGDSGSDSPTWGADSRVWCFATDDGTFVFGNATACASTLVGVTPLNSGVIVSGKVQRIFGAGSNASNVCWAEIAGTSQRYLQRCTVNPTTGVVTDAGISYYVNQNCYLASRVFTADGTRYVWALADFALQTQLHLLDQAGRVVARALTNGGAAPSDPHFVSCPSIAAAVDSNGATNYHFAARRRAQLKFDAAGNVSTTVGAALINLQSVTPQVQAVQCGNSTYIGGPAPRLYDGAVLSELGFYFYPDTPTLTVQSGGGALSAGTYSYALTYGWYDNNGKLWRSPLILIAGSTSQPNGSSAASITVNANDAVQVTNIRYLQGSLKPNAFIELWRTKANLTQFYKITQIDNVVALNSLSTSYLDTLADASVTGEVSYTDGSSPSYLSPPAFSYLVATPSRVYGLASETNEVWVSNLTTSTTPAQFLLGQTLTVPTLATAPNCMEIMDGQLYVFSSDGILTTNADGTFLSSTQSLQFSPPRQLPVDAGCTAPSSLLRTEQGIWFQSAKGLTRLSRQQQAEFVGEPVKNYTDTILASMVLPMQQQIRFVQGARTLVFDYVWNRWSVYTGQTPVSATRWNGAYTILTSAGVTKQEVTGQFQDDGVNYALKVVTPWIKPAGINGYARCWRFVVLGENRSPHTLQVRLAYQYDDTWIDTVSIASSATNPNTLYGSGLGTYGRTKLGVYGSYAANVYQFVAVMPRQKATAFRFELTDQSDTGTGEAAVLTMLTLMCGGLPGVARLPASKGMG